jgi:predicted O-methyltransferase YrrM
MSLRNNLRAVARRIPPFSSYERQLDSLNAAASKLFVPPGHFYSPIPSLTEVAKHRKMLFDFDPADIKGVNLRVDEQWDLAEKLKINVARTTFARNENKARELGQRYWTDNTAYAQGDALFLSLILQEFRPQRMVELGCGFSSACTLDTRDAWLDGKPQLTFVDPYPQLLERLLRESDRDSVEILACRSQDLPLSYVTALESTDVLFVDSTHISKTGSDVNAVLFDLLPALAPGVIIHFHDMLPGFEYYEEWVMEGRAWNELYTMRAFLQFNDEFEIILWPSLLAKLDPVRLFGLFPSAIDNVGGSLWLRRRGQP